MKNREKNFKPILMFVLILAISFCIGLLGGKLFKPVFGPILKDMLLGEFFVYLLALYICLLLFSFVQTVVHEAGHLIFGLLTGYRFSSFRIGSFMWLKKDGKKAETTKAVFEKAAIRYPYTHEIASERAMIELVEKKFEENSVEVEAATDESSEVV